MDESRRQGILEAAGRAFSRLGFRKTSIADIARAAGVAKGTIYLCSKNKEDLFYQVLLRDMREFLAEVAKAIDPRVPADELLRDIAQRSLEFIEARPLIRDLITGPHYQDIPGWELQFEAIRALGRSNIAEILRLGVRQGRFREDLDIEATSAVLQDIHHSAYIFHARSHGDSKNNMDELFKGLHTAIDLLIRGLHA